MSQDKMSKYEMSSRQNVHQDKMSPSNWESFLRPMRAMIGLCAFQETAEGVFFCFHSVAVSVSNDCVHPSEEE